MAILRILTFLVLLPLVPASAGAGGKLQVFVSIEPIRYLVERVGGAYVSVETVVKAGYRPETYEPTPRGIAALSRADVFFGAGMPLENVWRKQVRSAGDGRAGWVNLASGLNGDSGAVDAPAPNGHGDHEHHDPHTWLSPVHAQHMTAVISTTLSRLEPQRADVFAQNAEQLRQELGTLHREIAGILEESGVRSFLVFHPAWGHFARAYGLEQIAIESGGKEPGPKTLIDIINKAKQRGIRTVFIEPGHGRRLAETVAAAIGGEVKELGPLAYEYISNLRSAASAIAASAAGSG